MILVINDNVIQGIGESLVDENCILSNGMPIRFAFDVEMREVETIPSEVEPIKYCYTEEDGFYPNPNWVEPNPYGIPNEVYNQIVDDTIYELIEQGVIA